MYNENVPVLIVGAGPVGLTASLLLTQYGVRSMLVERHPSTSIHPRARGFNFRSMEIFRGLGLEAGIRAAGSDLSDSRGLLVVESLAGREFARVAMDDLFYEAIERASPTGWCLCAQDQLEPVLREAADARGGDLRFRTELVSHEQDAEGVTALLRDLDTGGQTRVRAQYLIGADGAASRVRRALNIELRGRGTIGHYVNIYFGADLSALVEGRKFVLCEVDNAQVRGIFASVNGRDLWQFFTDYKHDEGETLQDFPPERCIDLVRKGVGIPDLPVEIKSVLTWEAAVRVADRFADRRVLLAGDAVHQIPPAGAYGASTGIQEAHNLAWKLSLVLKGLAAPSLLDTYEMERRPVARFTAEQAGMRMRRELRTSFNQTEAEHEEGLAHTLLVTAGYHYRSPAVLADGVAPPSIDRLALAGRPGERMPHVWLAREGQRVSTLDLLEGDRFLLLAGAEGAAWRDAARAVAGRRGLPLDALCVGGGADGVVDSDGRWAETFGVAGDGAVLVRPDGFVAWRSPAAEADATVVLDAALVRLLGLQA